VARTHGVPIARLAACARRSHGGRSGLADASPPGAARHPVLSLTDSATRLAKALVRQGALPEKATVDAFHIGVAAAHQVTYLLTWNCKHLANATMRGTIEDVCRSEGLSPPIICTPEELPARRPS
jgi:hypothetical protein